MKKVFNYLLLSTIIILGAINIVEADFFSKDSVNLDNIIKVANANSESGSCCEATSPDEHCGMTKK